jgi:hypothetical protein
VVVGGRTEGGDGGAGTCTPTSTRRSRGRRTGSPGKIYSFRLYTENPPSGSPSEWEISPEDALYHVRALESMFPVAFEVGRAVSARTERPRIISGGGESSATKSRTGYKVRNFYVQSPASLVCLEKLIRLDSVVSGVARDRVTSTTGTSSLRRRTPGGMRTASPLTPSRGRASGVRV